MRNGADSSQKNKTKNACLPHKVKTVNPCRTQEQNASSRSFPSGYCLQLTSAFMETVHLRESCGGAHFLKQQVCHLCLCALVLRTAKYSVLPGSQRDHFEQQHPPNPIQPPKPKQPCTVKGGGGGGEEALSVQTPRGCAHLRHNFGPPQPRRENKVKSMPPLIFESRSPVHRV